jgi:hypothetical protein
MWSAICLNAFNVKWAELVLKYLAFVKVWAFKFFAFPLIALGWSHFHDSRDWLCVSGANEARHCILREPARLVRRHHMYGIEFDFNTDVDPL